MLKHDVMPTISWLVDFSGLVRTVLSMMSTMSWNLGTHLCLVLLLSVQDSINYILEVYIQMLWDV